MIRRHDLLDDLQWRHFLYGAFCGLLIQLVASVEIACLVLLGSYIVRSVLILFPGAAK